MRITRTDLGVTRREIRPGLETDVRQILEEVRTGGDDAVLRLTERLDNAVLGSDELRVDPRELEGSIGVIEPEVLRGLRTSIANVRAVARAQLRGPLSVELEQGQRVELVEVPVHRAAVYVPGGRAPYPSTVVMGAVTARTAGVGEIVVCSPPGPDGRIHPVILAACALCEVNEVYRIGGAQAIGALAYGTASVRPVDVIAGPGNSWVQEAKRQVAFTEVGIDGIAGPSELEVSAAGGEGALWMAEDLAPEHLELVGDEAEQLADRVRRAGCVFVGAGAGTAFGDYVAGSNHVLPTGGAARFQSAVSAATFRRRMARVSLPDGAP